MAHPNMALAGGCPDHWAMGWSSDYGEGWETGDSVKMPDHEGLNMGFSRPSERKSWREVSHFRSGLETQRRHLAHNFSCL